MIAYVAIAGVSLDNETVLENKANEVVGWFGTTGGNAPYSYELVTGTGDTDNASFQVIGNNLILREAADYEKKKSYSLRAKSTDDYGTQKEGSFTVEVIDLNDAGDEGMDVVTIILISMCTVLFFLLIVTVCICAARTKQLEAMQDPHFQEETAFMHKVDHPTDQSVSRVEEPPSFTSKIRPLPRLREK